MNWYDFLLRDRSEVFERSVEHIGLVAASMAIALAIGLPLGIALVRRLTLQRWVLGAANVIQTIPSLALFGCRELHPARRAPSARRDLPSDKGR